LIKTIANRKINRLFLFYGVLRIYC